MEWRNPFAAYALGSMYHYGQGVEKNEEKKQAHGQCSSGYEYDYGEGQTM